MAGYTYDTYVAALQVMAVSKAPDVPFATILSSVIDYAEQRIYRELDLLQTVQTDTSVVTDTTTRVIQIPNTFVVVNNIAIFSPAGSSREDGERRELVPVSRAVLDTLWPGTLQKGTPEMFSIIDQWTMALGPCPDGAYTVETVGTYRPPALSANNTVTFISERLPDLFMAASMIFISGYQRNFGQQANDPQMGTSWEGQYELLKGSAETEEARKHFWASAWSSMPVPAQAAPPRG